MATNATTNLSGFLRRLTLEMAAETQSSLSDQQLITKALTGCDETVFQALVRRHGRMVYGVCWRVLRNDADAEDAFQATFLVLAQKLRTVRKQASLSSWLHTVAQRIALKAQTHAAARRRHERQALVHEAAPHEDAMRTEASAILDSELARLSEKWRLPLILCYLEGRTQDEAADQLGLSKNTLRNRLEEGRKLLAGRLTRRGVIWPAVLSAVLLTDCIAVAAPAARLFSATVQAAVGVAAGKPVTLVASAEIATLTEGAMKTVALTKLKAVFLLLLVLGMIALGSGLPADYMSAAQEARLNPGEKAATDMTGKDAAALSQFPEEPERGDEVMAIRYSPTGDWLATAEMDGKVRLWDMKTQRLGPEFHGPDKMVRSIAFTPDGGTLVAGCDNFKIYVWDVRTGKLRTTLEGHKGWVCAVAVSSDGKTLATSGKIYELGAASRQELKIWDLVQEKLIHDIDVTKDEISAGGPTSLAFAPGTQLLAAACTGDFRGIKVWNAATGKDVKRFTYTHGFPVALALSPDGKWLVSGGGQAIRTSPNGSRIVGSLNVWDWASGKLEKTLVDQGESYYRGVAFSKDSTRLVATSSGPQVTRGSVNCVSSLVHCWEVKQWTRLWTVRGLYGEAWGLDLSPDGQRVTSSDSSGTFAIDAALGRRVGFWMTTPHKIDMEELGPIRVTRRPDWPDGMVDAVNLESRVYSQWINGTEHYYYRGGARALNEAMQKFAAVKKGDRRLVLLPGTGKAQTVNGTRVDFDWQLQLPGGFETSVFKLTEAVMTVYVNASKPKPVDQRVFDRLVKELNSESFPVRTAATSELQKMGNNAKPLIRAALKTDHTLEMRRRLESLLEKLPVWDLADLEVPKGVTLVTADDLIAKSLQDLKNADRKKRMQAVQDLRELTRLSDKIVPLLIETFEKDKDAHIRQVTAACLDRAGFQGNLAIPVMKKGLHDPDANIRYACQLTLRRLAISKETPEQREQTNREAVILNEINEWKRATRND